MDYKLEELIDVNLLQSLQEKLNNIYSFPSAIIDNNGKVLTAVAWQDICTKFHRKHPKSEKECIKSDQFILDHLHEANPAVSYQCPHGLIDNATPIIIDGKHLGNFFTGQFFLDKKPDIDFFKQQAKKFGFDEAEYLNAVEKVPVWTKEKLNHYLDFIKGFIEIIASIGLKNLREIEANEKIKQNEKLIEAEKQRLSYILEGTNVGTWEWNIVTGETVFNERWANIIGYTLEEISPVSINTWVKFVHPEDIKKSSEILQKHFRGELDYYEVELRMRHKTGDWVWILDRGKVYEWDDLGNPLKMAGTHQDITERKLSERALKESETNLRNIIENSPVGYHVYTLKSDNRLIFRMFNPAADAILHISHQQFIGKEILEAFPALAGTGIPEMYIAIAKGEIETQNFEGTYNHNGIEGVYDVRAFRGTPGQVVVNFTDISERKQTEEALKQSEAKFRGLFQNTASGIVVVSLQKIFLQVNEAFCNMLGYSEEELIGHSFQDITFPDDKDLSEKMIREIIEGNKVSAQFEKRYLHKNGNVIWGLVSIALFRNSDNQPLCFVTQVVDITLRKQAEESLKQNQIILKSLLNGIHESALLIDTEGNILAANVTVEQRLTGGKKKLIGNNVFQFLPEDVAIQRKEKLRIAIEQKKSLRFEDSRFGRTIDNCVTPILNDNGDVEVIALIGIDITDRINIEKALKENQELLSLYILNSPVYTYIKEVTPTESRVIEASNSFVNMIGLKAEDMIGKTMEELFPIEFAKKITKDDWAVIESGKTLQIEEELNGKNYVTIKFPIIKDKKCLLAGYTIDVTESKQAEKKLKEREANLRSIIENSPVGYYIYSLESDNRLIFRMFNPAADAILHISHQQFIGKEILEAFPALAGTGIPEMYLAIAKGELEAQNFEVTYNHREINGIFDVRAFKSATGQVIVNFTDITKRKHVEKALQESEHHFRTLANGGTALIWTSGTDKLCNYFNEPWLRYTGRTLEQELENGWADGVHPEDYERCLNIYNTNFDRREPFSMEYRLRKSNGEYGWILDIGNPRYDSQGNFIGYIGFCYDITERKLVETELEKYRNHLEELVKIRTQELERANELLRIEIEKEKEFEMILQNTLLKEKELSDIKSRFISTTSHEFRTPLTTISFSTDLLKKYGEKWSTDKKEEHYTRITNAVKYLTNLLEDILTLNRAESGKMKYELAQIDLKTFAMDCISDAKTQITDKHTINFNYELIEEEYFLDPKLMKSIFNNLLSNAVKYSPDGGKIEFKISKDKNALIFEISDEGMGIPSEDLNKIFEPFYRTKNAEEISGSGLGLSIVQKAVELHNGNIKVESELGKWTKFRVTIPVVTKIV